MGYPSRMKSFNQVRCALFLSVLWLCPPVFAKDYIVEMIFFASVQDIDESSLHISARTVTPDLQGAILLDDSAVFYDFLPLSQEALRLGNQAAALTASGKYRVMKHIAWLQPGLSEKEAIPVRIQAGRDYSSEFRERASAQTGSGDQMVKEKHPVNELDGTIKVVLGRYLHVFTDLVYRRPFNVKAAAGPDMPGQDFVLADFTLQAHRKMRSKKLHYIDHPLFGILVEIHPAENEN